MQIPAKPIWNNQVALDKLLKKESRDCVGLGGGMGGGGQRGKNWDNCNGINKNLKK